MQSEGYFLKKTGAPSVAFELKEFEIADPIGNEILIEVEAFGLNYADVMARKGLYQDAPPFPCVVGYEVVGKVIKCGPDTCNDLMGKRVMAFCRFGGYARHVITFEDSAVEVENQPSEELLALCTQGVTAYYMAYYLTPIYAADTVLIHAAAGGVGTLLIQLAKLKGATVIAKVGRSEKEELVKILGADHVVNYNTADYQTEMKSLLKGKKIDISFNPVAGGTFKKDMAMLGAGGRMVLFGGSDLSRGKFGIFSKLNFVRKMGFVIPVALMMKSKNILGVNMLQIADNKPEVLRYCLTEMFDLYREGKIKPQVGGTFSSDELFVAHKMLEKGESTGKLTVKW